MKTLSLDAFIAHLERVVLDIPHAQKAGIEAATGLIQQEAKSIIGTYQRGNMGPFAEWEELAPATKQERDEQGFTMNDPLERERTLMDHIMASSDETRGAVGVPSVTVQHSYEHEDENIGDIATDLEFGTVKIPPRSFLGVAGFRKGHEAAKLIALHVAWTIAGMPYRARAPKVATDD
jgi:hypothetical protein